MHFISRPALFSTWLVVPLLVGGWQSASVSAEDPLLKSGDRLAIVGGTLVERMQADGQFEAQLHLRRPAWNLSLRNLGWSGDTVTGIARKRFDQPADGYARLLSDIEQADPSVVMMMYGFAEAANGQLDETQYASQLTQLVKDIREETRRVILVTPFPIAGIRTTDYKECMERCRNATIQVGESLSVPTIRIDWVPQKIQLTEDQLQLNESGFASLASKLCPALTGQSKTLVQSSELLESIRSKNQLYFHHYRPQNETYLFLFRKHEQGNNAVEMEAFAKLVREADASIWKLVGDAR